LPRLKSGDTYSITTGAEINLYNYFWEVLGSSLERDPNSMNKDFSDFPQSSMEIFEK
jgi:hypothetical protein